jgi:hypothetical protein
LSFTESTKRAQSLVRSTVGAILLISGNVGEERAATMTRSGAAAATAS